MRDGVRRMKGECNGKKIYTFSALVRDDGAGVIAMLKSLNVCSNIRIARQSALIYESTVDSKAWIRYIWI